MDEKNEIMLEILKVIVEGENKRNKLFEHSLRIFIVAILGVSIILSTANIVLFANMFVNT